MSLKRIKQTHSRSQFCSPDSSFCFVSIFVTTIKQAQTMNTNPRPSSPPPYAEALICGIPVPEYTPKDPFPLPNYKSYAPCVHLSDYEIDITEAISDVILLGIKIKRQRERSACDLIGMKWICRKNHFGGPCGWDRYLLEKCRQRRLVCPGMYASRHLWRHAVRLVTKYLEARWFVKVTHLDVKAEDSGIYFVWEIRADKSMRMITHRESSRMDL